MTQNLAIAVISGSSRPVRTGSIVSEWVVRQLRTVDHFDVDLIDLAEVELPPYSELQSNGARPSPITDRLARADAFVVITPEYNHSYPASLKHAIDWHYREWMFKPATLVSYGVFGGVLAAEHLRSVFAELHVMTTRRVVSVAAPWSQLDTDNVLEPEPSTIKDLEIATSELTWWTRALKAHRESHPYEG